MRTISVLLLASFCLCAAADLPSGDALMQRSLDRTGGDAYRKAKSLTITGTVEIAGQNLSGPVSIYQQGQKSYTVIELAGIGKVEEGFDGKVAWEMNALQGARVKTGDERAAVMRASRMSLLSSWRDYYKSAKTVGEADVDGKPAWKVEMTPTEGKPETFFFDKDSGYLVRMAQTLPSAMGDIPVEITMSDYREVNGIQTPFTMKQSAMNQNLAMHFDKVLYNADIPAGRFTLPTAIQELVKK